MKLSIVIRLKENEEFIGFTLQSILDFCPKGTEVIILNHNSDIKTIEKVQLFHELNYKIIDCSNFLYSPGKFLNFGISKCSNEIVLVLSSHVEITKQIDMELVNNYLNKYVAVAGKQIPIYKGKRINPRYVWSHFIDEKVVNMYSKIEDRYFLHNAFCFYDKKYITKFPFREDLTGKEDRYWINDQVESGKNFIYDFQFSCKHFYTRDGATWHGLN